MAYQQQRTQYGFSDTAKAAMILYLEQFPAHMETITQIKESIRVPGAFLLDTYEAVILAALIRPYWPGFADKLMAPLATVPQFLPEEHADKHWELVDRLGGGL